MAPISGVVRPKWDAITTYIGGDMGDVGRDWSDSYEKSAEE